MSYFLNDVLNQPAELKRALEYYKSESVQKSLAAVKELKFGEIIMSGMGSSHFCSLPADVYLASRGIRSRVISAGELLHYESARIKSDTLLCLISQSGESAEIVRLIEKLPADTRVIAVTNNPDSTLGKRGDIVFELNVSNEKAVSTRTYVSSIILTMLIAFMLTGEEPKAATDRFDDLLAKMEAYLADYQNITEQLDAFSKGVNSVNIMGRGYSLGTVRASALFFREAARSSSTDFDSAEFRHGPMEMVEDGVFAVVLAPSGVSQDLNVKLAKDITDKGGRVVLITDKNAVLSEASDILRIDLPIVDEYMAPILQILPLQLLIDIIAVRKGLTSGDFRWGNKITADE